MLKKRIKTLQVYWVIKRSRLFDSEYYLKNNLDVARSCVDPVLHYIRYGWREGRNPNRLFDTEWYLQTYPDVCDSGMNPFYHYIQYGSKEGRHGLPAETRPELLRNADPGHFSDISRNSDLFFSILVPVYNHFEYLQTCVDSLMNQSYKNIEIVLVDDASTDPRVKNYLQELMHGNSRIKIAFNDLNVGISETINRGIVLCSGHYICFVDCDDFLPDNSISKVASIAKSFPQKKYFFSNRINVDAQGNEIEKVSFANRRRDNYRRELMKGMFTGHLKVFSRQVFLECGLIRAFYDSAQDYEYALRTASIDAQYIHYINDYLYYHRVYPEQVSTKNAKRQAEISDSIKSHYNKVFNILNGGRMVSIVVLSFNKLEHTLNCISSIKKSTEGQHEIILFDNNSDISVRDKLESFFGKDPDVSLYFSPENIGCGRGRKRGIGLARGEYIITLDNDIIVSKAWTTKLVNLINLSVSIGGACCKVFLPNGRVQFTGGKSRTEEGFVKFGFYDEGKNKDDMSTLEERQCEWIPGGATIYKRSVYDEIQFCDDFINSYEDNDFSMRVKQKGWSVLSCPSAAVLHNHVNFDPVNSKDRKYMNGRYDLFGIGESAKAFYRHHGLIIDDAFAFRALGLLGKSKPKIKAWFQDHVDSNSRGSNTFMNA